jgi:HAD superfamily hydrolase (TIGR01509 family)
MAEILTERGHSVTGEEAVARYAGLRWIDCHRKIEEESGLSFDPEELGRAIDEAVAARTAEMLAVEGIESFLAAQSHRKLAIASSSETSWLETILARLGLAAWFEGRLFSAAGFSRGKPHPDIYLHASERLGVAPERCLVIEDHPIGVAAGASAGMTVIALLAASHIREGHADRVRAAGAHHVASDYAEAAEIVEQLER